MKGKSILTASMAGVIAASLCLSGCGNISKTKTGNSATNNMKEGVNNAANEAKNAAESTGEAIRYTAKNFKDDLLNAGYKISDLANNTKDYFKGKETDYKLGNDIVRVYEYETATDLQSDINRIAPNGMTINGTTANYATSPYYYSKGNTLIVYEGKEPTFVDQFNKNYGVSLRP